MRIVISCLRSISACAVLLTGVTTAIAQQVPPKQTDPGAPTVFSEPSQIPPPPRFPLTQPTLLIPAPDPCDTNPCIRASTGSPPTAPEPQWAPGMSAREPPPPTLGDVTSSAANAKTAYEVAQPISNAAATSLSKGMGQYALKLPELAPAVGPVIDGVQVGVKAYNGYQNGGGVSGALSAGGKELAKTVVDDCVTAAVTCMAAETGPLAPAIGIAAGKAAGAATEYLIDHPDVLPALFPCDDNGVCISNMDSQGSGSNSARQAMEATFDQASATNDAAAAQASQQAADAQAAQSSQSDSGVMDFLAALSVGLNSSATLQQSQHAQTAPAPSSQTTSAIPPGWLACTCPSQHASVGRMINGTLYHAAGPQCK